MTFDEWTQTPDGNLALTRALDLGKAAYLHQRKILEIVYNIGLDHGTPISPKTESFILRGVNTSLV